MVCEHWNRNGHILPAMTYKIYPKRCVIDMNWKVDNTTVPNKIKLLSITQFPVVTIIDTT